MKIKHNYSVILKYKHTTDPVLWMTVDRVFYKNDSGLQKQSWENNIIRLTRKSV